MTQTNTDYLLQVTSAVTDRTYGATGANDNTGRFDDHLSQAATLSGDDSRNQGGSSQRTDTTRPERDERAWNNGDLKPSSHDGGNTTSSQAAPSDQEGSTDAASGSNAAVEDADTDEHKSEETDDSTAAEVAGASQAAKVDQSKSGSKPEPKVNKGHLAAVKAAATNKKAATETGDRKATGIPDGTATVESSSEIAATQHADEAAQQATIAATETAKTAEEPVESSATASEDEQPKGVRRDASKIQPNKGSSASKDVVGCNDESVGVAGTGEIAPTAANKVSETVEASPALSGATALASKSEADEPADDESRTGLHDDTRPGARNDASVQTSKIDTAQLAVSAASPTDAGASGESKSKDSEPSTKPITAKGEPAAAAFARMARNNITGTNDSAAGSNDLPQVDPSRFIGRVAKAFQTAQDRGGTLQLRLSPPELGALRIELNVKDGVMSASLQTENANARRLLLDHLPALRDRLAEQNIRVDRFDVDVRDESSGQSGARGSQQQQFQHQPDQPSPRRQLQPQPRTREVSAPERMASSPIVGDTGLNLIV